MASGAADIFMVVNLKGEHMPSGVYNRKPTVKEAVTTKLKILREFGAVTKKNAKEIEERLLAEIKANPNRDYELVLDKIGTKLIMDYLESA